MEQKRFFRVDKVDKGWSAYVPTLDMYVGKVGELEYESEFNNYVELTFNDINDGLPKASYSFVKEWCTEVDFTEQPIEHLPECYIKFGNIEWCVNGVTTPETKLEVKDLDTSIRVFDTGASRNSDEGKLDFEGFLSPLALKAYAEYMHENRKLEDGSLRESDNWQCGIPKGQYMKSLYRHFFDTWTYHRGFQTKESQIKNLCGVLFNTMGYLHELLKEELDDNTGNN